MIFRQLFHEGMAAASYLIGCIAKGEAAVIDPALPAETYITLAAEKGLQIKAVFETHMHADYYSTGRAIQALTGATIYAPRLADVQFPHHPIDDNDEFHIGNLVVRAIHTPGHTPEHTAYAVSDTPRAARPWFVMTGDSLFVGDVARVDLVDIPGTGTDIMYSSMQKLLALPDDVEIYPGHFGGSACGGRAMSGKASSTIGFERRFNWALQAPDEQTFNEWMKQDVREAVDGILMHRNTNRGELPLPAGYFGSHATSMPLNDMRDAQAQGVLVLDVRPTAVFNLGHMAGVINIPFQREVMLDRARALLGSQESLIVYADTLATAETAAAELRGAGFQVVGVSMAKLGDVVTLPTVTIDDLHQTVLNGGLVVDVREPHEHAKGTIEGAILLPLLSLPHEAKNLPDVPLNLVCESGTRATIAATYLKSLGKQVATVVVPGGMSDYNAKYAEALKA